ncbi:MAG: AI-2E family transporter [Alphaproteobacteria bacterium]
MSARHHLLFWLSAFAALLLFITLFADILLPFALGIAVAYLLNPLVNAFSKLRLSRRFSALLILTVFFSAVLAFLAVLTPLLYKQTLELAEAIPSYVESAWALAEPFSKKALAALGQENNADIKDLLSAHSQTVLDMANRLLQGLGNGGQAALDLISVIIFMPVVAYFMMKEWPSMTGWVKDLLPREHKMVILDLLKQIDRKLSGFVRGQISVAVLLGALYAIALSLIGLKYGFLIGLGAGLLSVIPMVGSFIGLVVSLGVACFQWIPDGQWALIGGVAAIFIAGQLIEGNILTPKLVGESVGLHPLWVFFALLAGGSLFGIVGMLLAVPVAAVASVLIAFGLSRYKDSAFYHGKNKKPTAKTQDDQKG